MSTYTSIIDGVTNFVANHSYLSTAATAICTIAAFELAIRSINRVCFSTHRVDKNILSRDLAGALLYGICAFNPFPYAIFLGSIVFIYHSLMSPDNYFSSKIIHKIFEKTSDLISKIANTVRKIFAAIFNVISLPENPLWYLVGAAIVLTSVYTGIPRSFF